MSSLGWTSQSNIDNQIVSDRQAGRAGAKDRGEVKALNDDSCIVNMEQVRDDGKHLTPWVNRAYKQKSALSSKQTCVDDTNKQCRMRDTTNSCETERH